MTNQGLSRWTRVYVGSVAVLGVCAIAHSAYTLYAIPIGWSWFVLAVLTLISGSATVKLPSVPATISISETFVFTSVLLFGPAAGTLTVALDALVISLWLARKGHPFYRIAFNVCALPASLWLAAHIFYWTSDLQPLSLVSVPVEIGGLLGSLFLFTVTYFLLNSWLIAFAISLEKRLAPFRVWRDNFAWLSLNYFGGASVAALLVTYTRNIDYAYLAFVLPLLAVLYFTFSMSMGRVEDANRHLSELNTLYMSTIETLAMAIDAKDQITHGHIRRVQHYATSLARTLGVKDNDQIRAIEAASLLHDMGKLAVPEYILNKPGALTPAEFEKIKLHASVGADILSAIAFPYPVVPIVRHHHENWDGTGYPDGLRGMKIPIGARILSVVDCYDALTSDRPYRPRLSDADAIKILMERRGGMYDPLIVDAFINVHAQIAPSPVDYPGEGREGLSAIGRTMSPSDSVSSDSRLDDISASTEETLVLYDLARGLTGQLDLGDAADVISKHIRRIVPASTCVFYVYDSKADELQAHAAGEHSAHFSGLRIPRGQRLTGWVAANKQTILNSDPVLDLGEVARALRPRLRSCLSTPLLSDTDLVGVLTVYSIHRDAFTENHRRIIEVVARQVSHTVRHAIAYEENRSTTLKDQLTGLPNLQHLKRFVAAEMSAMSGPANLSLVFVDCESLKAINRRFGRDASDQALGKVADAIKKALRSVDILFRYGDDEFVVLLTQTESEAALAVARRIAEHISQQTHNPTEGRISVTLGVASVPADGVTVEALVSAARRKERTATAQPGHQPPSIH
jgi:diguanylate cyclase (GGDEF)-like protein/putative nucleotidyltransferase with HDIG domain